MVLVYVFVCVLVDLVLGLVVSCGDWGGLRVRCLDLVLFYYKLAGWVLVCVVLMVTGFKMEYCNIDWLCF